MNPPTTEQTQAIHRAYRALTGLDVPYTMQTHFVWEAWLAAGYTEPDLACVVRYIKRRIEQRRREKESLSMRNLIARRDNFAEDLAIARAESRQQTERNHDAAKKSVLAATGRKLPEKQAKSAAEILRETEFVKNHLAQWRMENGML